MEHLVDVEQGSVVPSRQWVDTPGRLRTEYLASYEGLALTSVLGEGERLRLSFGEDGNREMLVAGQLSVTPRLRSRASAGEAGSGTKASLFDALNELIGRTVITVQTGRDGSLDLGFDQMGSSSAALSPVPASA